MKKLMIYTMTALLATAAVSIAVPSNEEMMTKEKAAWQAFKDKDADGFKRVVDGDMIGVYEDGIADMAKEMSDARDIQLNWLPAFGRGEIVQFGSWSTGLLTPSGRQALIMPAASLPISEGRGRRPSGRRYRRAEARRPHAFGIFVCSIMR